MKIKKIEIYRLSIPMEPFVIATGVMDYAQNTFVKIYTDTPIYGVGECSAFPMIVGETQNTCISVAQDFAKIWLNKNPLDITERLAELDLFIAGNTTIKSAFDNCLYDIAAKHAGLPLYKFLGGERRDLLTDITIGISSPQEMATKASEWQEKGAEVIKVKLGKNPLEDVERVKAIRKAVGFDMAIRLDANQGWSFSEAETALVALEPFKIQFCEQPMRTYNDELLRELRTRTIIPIMADESVYSFHDAERLCRTESCDLLNIKFSKSGGIQGALAIHAIAEEYQMPCMIGGMLETRLGLAAKAHFAYAAPNVKYFDLDTCMVGHLIDPVIGGLTYQGFQVAVSEELGIGADIDQAFLDQCDCWIIE